MGHQFIRQPDGKWAIWSSVVDDFVALDCEEWELFALEASDQANCEYLHSKQAIDNLKNPNGRRRYTQMTWEAALEHRAEIHGPRDPDVDEQDSRRGREGFKYDPSEEQLEREGVPELDAQPRMDSIEDFFRLKLSQIMEFYYWYMVVHEARGWAEPPDLSQEGLEEPRRTPLRHKHTLQHYETLLRCFAAGQLHTPRCPHCKEITSESSKVCEACGQQYEEVCNERV